MSVPKNFIVNRASLQAVGLVYAFEPMAYRGSNVITDLSGYNNTGALTGGSFTSNYRLGSGINFNGSSDYINILSNNTLKLTNFTIDTWFMSKTEITGGASQILAKGNSGRNYSFSWDHASSTFQQAIAIYSGTTWYPCKLTTSLVASTLYHVTATYGGNVLSIYLSGALENSVECGAPTTDDVVFRIGCGNSYGTPYNPASYFNGNIYRVRLYNRALSSAEILKTHTEDSIWGLYQSKHAFLSIPGYGDTNKFFSIRGM